jgi:pimeloyl-ACP methyl ester carboxylesterase
VRWSESGDKLLLRVRETDARLFDPFERRLAAAPEFDQLWSPVRIEAITHGDTEFYRQAEALDLLGRIHAEGAAVRTIATIGPAASSFLVFRRGNGFRFTAYEGQQRWETGVPIAFASASLLPPGSRQPHFLGDQSGYSSFTPYALPLIDRMSGRTIGRFGQEQIELRDGRTFDLLPHFNQIMSIQDASANGHTIFALVDLEREMRVVRLRGDEVRSWRVCEKRGLQLGPRMFPPLNSLSAETPVKRTLIRFRPDAPASDPGPFALLYRPLRETGQLVVYFHGGPTTTISDTTVPQVISRFAAIGVSVLAVEQSGMLGGGLSLSKRLPRLGFQALREDVAAATDWARTSGFREFFVLADSFGGASAAIAAAEHADFYAHVFLRAPFLALRDPEQSVRRNNFSGGQVPADSQREFEETVYGGPEGRAQFGTDLQSMVRRLRPSPKISFYFGSFDPVSSVKDLPAEFGGSPSVTAVRARHEAVGGLETVWEDILAKMAAAPNTVSNAPKLRQLPEADDGPH